MIAIGTLNPIDQIPSAPDTVQVVLIASSSGQAMDWAASSLTQLVRVSMLTTAGALSQCFFNPNSTRASAPSSGLSTGTSTGALPSVPIPSEGRFLQIPSGSTGFSVASLTSGYVSVECWRK